MKFPDFIRRGGIPVGAPEDFPAGSVERAKLLSVNLISTWDLVSTTEELWSAETAKAKKESAHKRLGFKDFDTYLDSLVGKERKKRFKTRDDVGQGKRSDLCNLHKSQSGRAEVNQVSRRTQIWLDRLARDRPDLLERVNNGELKTFTAAKLAGIVKVPTPLEKGKKAFLAMDAREQREFRRWLEQQ